VIVHNWDEGFSILFARRRQDDVFVASQTEEWFSCLGVDFQGWVDHFWVKVWTGGGRLVNPLKAKNAIDLRWCRSYRDRRLIVGQACSGPVF